MYQLKHFFCLILLVVFTNAVNASTLNKVLESGELRVGVSLYEPWAFKDNKDKLIGFEIQIAKQLARDLNARPKFIFLEWADLISALEKERVDIIITGMAITPERALRVSFSNPYASAGIDIAALLSKTEHMNSLDELNNPKVIIGVVIDTVPEKLARKMFAQANVKLFKKHRDVNNAILKGEIHAWIESTPIPRHLALEYPDKIDTPLSKPLIGYKTGMAINKGNQEFLNYLNSWITARDADDWISSRHKFWFESLDWKKDNDGSTVQ